MSSRTTEILDVLNWGAGCCGMSLEPSGDGWELRLEWWDGDADRWTTAGATAAACLDALEQYAIMAHWIAPLPTPEGGPPMSRLCVETPEHFHGQAPKVLAPVLAPVIAVDWQRMAQAKSEFLAAALDEIDRLRASNKSLHIDLGLLALSRDHEHTLRVSCEAALKRDQAALLAACQGCQGKDAG